LTFCEYYKEWVNIYKVNAVRPVTLMKYKAAIRFIELHYSNLAIGDMNKRIYQGIINKYSENHHATTTRDFNNCLKAAILDAVDEGLVKVDPCRKVVITKNMCNPRKSRKTEKYLNYAECQKLIALLELDEPILRDKLKKLDKLGRVRLYNGTNWDWFILLCLKTGLRFSEALALTRGDFDFEKRMITVNKTFDYKITGKITDETKTKSSMRKILIDKDLSKQFDELTADMPAEKAIFIADGNNVFNSTVNYRLTQLCKKAEIPVITIHGLRHSHASILLYKGISIHSISRRLGHSNVSVTQDVYLHIIKELEDKDNDKIVASLSGL